MKLVKYDFFMMPWSKPHNSKEPYIYLWYEGLIYRRFVNSNTICWQAADGEEWTTIDKVYDYPTPNKLEETYQYIVLNKDRENKLKRILDE